MLSEGEDGRSKVETIVRLFQFSHRDTCSCRHPDRMRGDPEETSVISTGIREAYIEIPVVCLFLHRRQLLSNSDHTVRVLATVHGLHPLVRYAKPRAMWPDPF